MKTNNKTLIYKSALSSMGIHQSHLPLFPSLGVAFRHSPSIGVASRYAELKIKLLLYQFFCFCKSGDLLLTRRSGTLRRAKRFKKHNY